MVAMLAAMHGWRVLYLGPDLPAEEIAYAVSDIKAELLMLSITNLGPKESEREVAAIEEALPERVKMLVGGRAATAPAGSRITQKRPCEPIDFGPLITAPPSCSQASMSEERLKRSMAESPRSRSTHHSQRRAWCLAHSNRFANHIPTLSANTSSATSTRTTTSSPRCTQHSGRAVSFCMFPGVWSSTGLSILARFSRRVERTRLTR